jgi:hypothetical protein
MPAGQSFARWHNFDTITNSNILWTVSGVYSVVQFKNIGNCIKIKVKVLPANTSVETWSIKNSINTNCFKAKHRKKFQIVH